MEKEVPRWMLLLIGICMMAGFAYMLSTTYEKPAKKPINQCKKWTEAVNYYESTMYGTKRTSDGVYMEYLQRKQWRDEACKKEGE